MQFHKGLSIEQGTGQLGMSLNQGSFFVEFLKDGFFVFVRKKGVIGHFLPEGISLILQFGCSANESLKTVLAQKVVLLSW